jgi:hypothetical protein
MEVEFEPYKRITFQSHLCYETAEEFVKVIALPNPQGIPFMARLFWANGILFRFFNHFPSEALSKEILAGHLIFDHIEFAPMPTFERELKAPERPLGIIDVLDVSKHAVFDPLTTWIAHNLIKK